MNRTTQRKLSRALVLGLGATIALGGVFWLGKIAGSSSTDAQQSARLQRGETTEAAVAASHAASDPAAAPATTAPSAAAAASPSDPFDSSIAQAGVLETPGATSTLLGASPATQTSSSSVLLAANETVSTAAPGADPELASHAAAKPAGAAPSSTEPIALGKALVEQGKLLDARQVLNTAITHGQLTADADVKSAKKMLNEINEVVVFSSRKFKDDAYAETFVVPPGGVLEKIARSHEITVELLQKMNGISDPRSLRAGQSLKLIKGPFHAVVNKRDYTLELWLGEPNAKGSLYVTSYPVGLGADDSTPTGVWAVKNRLSNPAYFSPRGEGVIAADDPKNPLGEYWIGLTGTDGNAVGQQSYGIHGTIEPDTIGKQASLGCIRLTNDNVAKVFAALVKDNSTVTVKE